MVKVFTFLKDEIKIVDDWLTYHSNLFGVNNIHVIDHMSTDGTEKILEEWKNKGLNIYKCDKPFSYKNKKLTEVMVKEKTKDCFLIPLDIDEFIVIDSNEGIVVSKDVIIKQINKLEKGPFRYKFSVRNNIPLQTDVNRPVEQCVHFDEKISVNDRSKTFYNSNHFISTDQGNHGGNVNGHGKIKDSGLTLLHYNIYDKNHFIKKMIRGAKAYGHDKTPNGGGGNGIHYKNNYWKIKNGEDVNNLLPKINKNTTIFNLSQQIKFK
jgi:hypothetical protein